MSCSSDLQQMGIIVKKTEQQELTAPALDINYQDVQFAFAGDMKMMSFSFHDLSLVSCHQSVFSMDATDIKHVSKKVTTTMRVKSSVGQ